MVAAAAMTSLAYGATPYVSYAFCAVNAWTENPTQHFASPCNVQPDASPAKQPAKPLAVPHGFYLLAVFMVPLPGLSIKLTLTFFPPPFKLTDCGAGDGSKSQVHVFEQSSAYQL